MAPPPTSRISGSKYPDDWRNIRHELVSSDDATLWKQVFTDYYESRLELRYFIPIHVLSASGEGRGEGFSIVAIQCSLIEFLESCWQGTNYRYLPPGQAPGPNEYGKSGDVFRSFLTQRQPFNMVFDQTLAGDFYTDIRCPVLHEACTKNGWRIWRSSWANVIIDRKQKILFRDNFQQAIEQFVAIYRAQLLQDRTRKDAFIRKFDYICS